MPTAKKDAYAFPAQQSDLRTWAKFYLEQGWNIVPVRAGTKKPNLIEWKRWETERVTLEVVDQWLADPKVGPKVGGWAVVCGQISGLVPIDIDPEKGGKEALQRWRLNTPEMLPKTLMQRTPHGWHAFYLAPEGRAVKKFDGIVPGVDIKGDLSTCTVAPTVTPDGEYRWVQAVPPVPLPRWAEAGKALPDPDLIPVDTTRKALEQEPWVTRLLRDGSPLSERNRDASRLAGYLWSKGMPQDVVLEMVTTFGERCRPSMDPKEVATVVRSVSRYAQQVAKAGIVDAPLRVDTGDGYRFIWKQHEVEVEFRGLRADSDGDIRCDLIVETQAPAVRSQLYGPVNFNLKSGQTRTNVVNYLAKTLQLDWASIFDQACRLAVEAHWEGDPMISLKDAVAPSGGQYALAPLLLSDAPTIWFSDGGVGKSLMALWAAIIMASGGELLGDEFSPQAIKRRRVLYLDWEWDGWEHKRRVQALLGSEWDQVDVFYQHCDGPLAELVPTLRRKVLEQGIDYIIVDSVAGACGGEPESSTVAIGYFNALRRLGCGSLSLADVSKASLKDQDPNKPFGSSFWHNMARLTYFVRRYGDEEDGDQAGSKPNTIVLGFYNKKSNSGPLVRPMGFLVSFFGDGFAGGRVAIGRNDLTRTDSAAATISLESRIGQVLKEEGPSYTNQIIEALGMYDPTFAPPDTKKEATLRTTLNRMRTRGKVMRINPASENVALWQYVALQDRMAPSSVRRDLKEEEALADIARDLAPEIAALGTAGRDDDDAIAVDLPDDAP